MNENMLLVLIKAGVMYWVFGACSVWTLFGVCYLMPLLSGCCVACSVGTKTPGERCDQPATEEGSEGLPPCLLCLCPEAAA